MSKLTPKQKKFCNEYLIDLNATQAAIRAGYSKKTANEQGARLLARVSVTEYLQKRLADRQQRTEITQDRVLQELAGIGFADAMDYARVEEKEGRDLAGHRVKYKVVELSPTEQIPRDKRAAIAGIKRRANGI